MIPADFDPFFAVTGVKRRDWTKPPATPAPSRAPARFVSEAK